VSRVGERFVNHLEDTFLLVQVRVKAVLSDPQYRCGVATVLQAPELAVDRSVSGIELSNSLV
jgi:hypothetical protein